MIFSTVQSEENRLLSAWDKHGYAKDLSREDVANKYLPTAVFRHCAT